MTASETQIVDILKKHGPLERRDLVALVRDQRPNSNEKTIAWRIHDLKQKGVIDHLTRGLYTVNAKETFTPLPTEKAKSIWNNLEGVLPGEPKLCLTETIWLNDWSLHQAFFNRIVIETEKAFAEQAFRELRYHFSYIYYDPDPKTFDYLISPDDINVIVKPLISEAPIEKHGEFTCSTLEKILVDLLCDTVYESHLDEVDHIYEEVFSRYHINQPKLRRYARRRNAEGKVNKLLHDHANHLLP